MMHGNNKQLSSSNINAQTTELKLSQLKKLSQLESNRATTNLSRSKLSRQAITSVIRRLSNKESKQKLEAQTSKVHKKFQ